MTFNIRTCRYRKEAVLESLMILVLCAMSIAGYGLCLAGYCYKIKATFFKLCRNYGMGTCDAGAVQALAYTEISLYTYVLSFNIDPICMMRMHAHS